MRSYQLELWAECNNNCTFCFNSLINKKTDDAVKINNLNFLIDNLSNNDFINQYDNISLIGGDFFQGQINTEEIRSLFYNAIQKVYDFMDADMTRSSWITATLTIGDQKDLYNILDMYKNTKMYEHLISSGMQSSNGLWICTSYDTLGRFHNQKMESNWKYHMQHIKELYPMIKRNTCFIMTDDLVSKYNDGVFTFTDFIQNYTDQIFLKQPDRGYFNSRFDMENMLPGFLPHRKNVLEFFRRLQISEPWVLNHIMNTSMRADILEKKDATGEVQVAVRDKAALNEYCDDDVLPCGHSTYYNCYVDSDKCIKCDLEKIKHIVGAV